MALEKKEELKLSAQVIQLVNRQHSCTRHLTCIDCGWTGEQKLPVLVKTQNIVCPGCEHAGHLIGRRKD